MCPLAWIGLKVSVVSILEAAVTIWSIEVHVLYTETGDQETIV